MKIIINIFVITAFTTTLLTAKPNNDSPMYFTVEYFNGTGQNRISQDHNKVKTGDKYSLNGMSLKYGLHNANTNSRLELGVSSYLDKNIGAAFGVDLDYMKILPLDIVSAYLGAGIGYYSLLDINNINSIALNAKVGSIIKINKKFEIDIGLKGKGMIFEDYVSDGMHYDRTTHIIGLYIALNIIY